MKAPATNRTAFIFYEGVVYRETSVIQFPEDLEWLPGVFDAGRRLSDAGFAVVIVMNVAEFKPHGYPFIRYFQKMQTAFREEGVRVNDFFWNFDTPKSSASAETQLSVRLRRFCLRYGFKASESVIFSAKPSEITEGLKAGIAERVLLGTNAEYVPSASHGATRSFRSLIDAVKAPWFHGFAKEKTMTDTDHTPDYERKICLPEELAKCAAALPHPVVFTNGVFDILHRGHATYLAEAAALGKSLIVAVNSDDSVRMLGKGPDRPINCAEDRAALVAALDSVSLVVVFDDKVPLRVIGLARPDVYVKGGDYRAEDLPEADLVESYGGRVEIIPFRYQRSTTSLLERIRRTPGKEKSE